MTTFLISTVAIIEIIGYLGSFFILASFLMKDLKWIRVINFIGALFFFFYGIFTKTWATVFMNAALMIVHVYYLVKMYIDRKNNKEIS